ncbi:hypothetical protein PAXINDRAFT_69907 [Paxillus involutus ATCC 200175]|nr:hypothetical protein PAXINDRAFT_69907 [Paxillus involutus ATCC 200175]
MLATYKVISASDLSVNKDVTEENRFGQGTDSLPWFWRMEGAGVDSSGTWMEEFYRINWLKAKARYCRWKEELELVKHKMYWVVKWFQGEELEWKRRARESVEAGLKAYAERKVLSYQRFAENALQRFQGKMSAM